MYKRTIWSLAIAISCFLGAGGIAPAWARGGINGSGAAGVPMRFSAPVREAPLFNRPVVARHGGFVPRHNGLRADLRLRDHARLRNGEPVVVWPYAPYFDTTPIEAPPVADETPVGPQVIILSNLPGGTHEPTVAQTLPDYGYVAGCHAIPNGYHCETHHDNPAP
jgi:hypothetical protein